MSRRAEQQPLVNERHDRRPSGSRSVNSLYTKRIGKVGYIFVALLVIQLVLGIVEFFFAVSWGHVVGLISAVILVAITGIHFHVVFIRDEHSMEKKKRLRIPLSLINGILSVWVLLLVLTHIFGASEVPLNHFPAACKKTTNCARLAYDNATNTEGLKVPVYNTDFKTITTEINAFFETSSLSTLIESSKDLKYFRWRTLTRLFAFPDDTYFRLSCTKDQKVSVEIQAEARLGTGDFGVNRARLDALLEFLEHRNIPQNSCQEQKIGL